MKLANASHLIKAGLIVASALFISTAPVVAQDYPSAPSFSTGQLDNLVSRVALYPDPLLAQVLAAAAFPDQIANAASWADQNRNLQGDQLAAAINQANLPFDPAVQSLLPFPTVLDMMASDLNWTSALGNAAATNQAGVMDAVQRMRQEAEQYGYLQSNQQIRVEDDGGAIAIEPYDPSFFYVPIYDPYVVFAPLRPGFFVGGAIGFGPPYPVGTSFGFAWRSGLNWHNREIVVNRPVYERRNPPVNNGRVYVPHATVNSFSNGNNFGTTNPRVAAPAPNPGRFGNTPPAGNFNRVQPPAQPRTFSAPRESFHACLLYTSDAADE